MSFVSLLKSFGKDRGWVKYQIDSFNKFIDSGISDILKEIGTIKLDTDVTDIQLKFGEVIIDKPIVRESDGSVRNIFPNEARIRNLTYVAPMWIKITPIYNGIEDRPEKVNIGELPVMIGSKICNTYGMDEQQLIKAGEDPQDPGGYFIINGTERVLVLIEEIGSNRPIFEKDGDEVNARINSERSGFKQKHLIERKPSGEITISFANVRKLPIIVLLKALGLETDKEICENVSSNPKILNELYINLYESEVTSKDEAIDYIGRKIKVAEDYRIERVNQLLDRYLLPHLGQEFPNRLAKAKYLSRVIKKTIELVMGEIPQDDIDHYRNKRLLMAGELLSQLFRSILLGRWGLIAKMTYNYQKLVKRGKIPTMQSVIEANAVTKQMLSSLATGNWIGGRTGVSQRLDRSCFIKMISHLRSVVSPLTSTQEHFSAREIHPTEWGRLCPAETPEGSSIGLRKHLAVFCEVTSGLDDQEDEKILKMIRLSGGKEDGKKADVYYNGKFIGEVPNPEKFVEDIKKKRRTCIISDQLNIMYYKEFGEIRINTDSGRARRPVIIVDAGKSRLQKEHIKNIEKGEWSWNDLIKNGLIEYLDAEEEEGSYIALTPSDVTPEHTHLEINPITIFGLSASLIPYPEYNRGDRINYGAKMVGQAIGIPSMNFMARTDTKFNTLNYPQIPIVDTDAYKILPNYDGQNVVVAVMCWDGYNLNDAIVLNKSSVERGTFRSMYYRTYDILKKRYWGGQEDEITIPDPSVKGYRGEEAYYTLEADGIIGPEVNVVSDSVLIGKVSPLRFLSGEEFVAKIENRRENSLTVRYGEEGVVDKVWISENLSGNQMIKIKIRDQRIPEIGDKFSTRHGQKGIVSLLVPQEDLPFTGDGVVPDIIFNPHGIPSRMTVGQLLELISGKTAALSGQTIEASSFNHMKEDDVRSLLKELGFREDGKQVLYDGRTGRKYDAVIYVGVSYFQKLDHMVANKIHARSRGPVTMLTKQPTEGRAKRGGLRLGEMEQQCIIGHGAALVLKERFSSDEVKLPVCKKCGMVAMFDKIKNKTICLPCNNSDIGWIKTSYAFKLTLDELKSMGIYPKIIMEEI